MSCKFKQIVNQESIKNIQGSIFAANDTVTELIDRVAVHMLNKKAQEKSKTFLKNKIISLEVDSVKQVYPNRPLVPNSFIEDDSPRHSVRECLRPMSAQVRHETEKRKSKNLVNQSKRTIISHSSFSSALRQRPNTASPSSNIEQQQAKKKRYQQRPFSSNQKRFFAIKTNHDNDDSIDQRFIEQLRARKFQQQEQIKKKQQFLKSIEYENKNFTQSQAKFVQTMNRKKFIYGQQGEIIQIGKNGSSNAHLKKISVMAKSRVQVKERVGNQVKRMQQQLKENIYIEFKGRQGFETRPQTAVGNNNNHNNINNNNKQPVITIRPQKQQQQPSNNNNNITQQQTNQNQPAIKTNNFLTINTIKATKPNQLQLRQQKSQTSLKNITMNKSLSRTNIKYPQHQTRTQLDIQDQNNLLLSQQQQQKKKREKIFFYPSVNSVYRVIDDYQFSKGSSLGNEDSLN